MKIQLKAYENLNIPKLEGGKLVYATKNDEGSKKWRP